MFTMKIWENFLLCTIIDQNTTSMRNSSARIVKILELMKEILLTWIKMMVLYTWK